ncbi:transcription elongation factor Spt5 [Candidatus Pacearchaeota archaeon CG_4_9_14_0_2_um_filter_39_13]|nr:transcription elongation factor Spt5 [Candidatus Pacearchaeota archaeon]OIO44097.1 MAG: transcription elongation factor Spt5 [Candidatus Pacearchaeota archaeon CG1_02_39_14]PJC44387.1 MAG: transcription elongation factor Spt5 [Candidatus Pacearchaeota archaeon CG_4_9_14_0_2_um_filter_39_13]
MAIYIVKVTTNKEAKALEMIADKARKKNLEIYSIVNPHGLRGYIIVEALDKDSVEEAAYNLPYVKGILPKVITYDEIKNMLQPEIEDFNIEVGDIVEMIADTFKNEKGKVMRIDKKKGEVVVSLLGAAVPIPVTVKMDNVRVIRREKDQEDEEQ